MYKNHLNSYNAFLDSLPHIISELPTVTIHSHKITIQSIDFTKPYQLHNDKYKKITPQSCIESLETYKCKCELTIRVNDQIRKIAIGTMPVMVGSKLCHYTVKDLSNHLAQAQTYIDSEETRRNIKKVSHIDTDRGLFDFFFERSPGEDTIKEPPGGYFIINGQEKVVRFLIVAKRHIPLLLERSSLGKKNKYFTDRAVQFRSVKNERGYNYFLHLCYDKNIFLRFIYKRKEYTVPVILILKALKDVTDREIVEQLGEEGRFLLNYEVTTRKMALLRLEGLFSSLKEGLLQFNPGKPQRSSSQENLEDVFPIAHAILNQIFCHLSNNISKFSCLVLCIRKLLYCKQIDDMDTTANHEVAGIGQILSVLFFDKLMENLDSLYKLFKPRHTDEPDDEQAVPEEKSVLSESESSSSSENESDELFDQKEYKDTVLLDINEKNKEEQGKGLIKKPGSSKKRVYTRKNARIVRELELFQKMKFTLCSKIENFLNTGNMQFVNTTDTIQSSGLVIMADRLNLYRFISQLESVNRGAFFSRLKTTTVRLLRPESYGFLCPVHTPDGAPCGLILHLSSGSIVTHSQEKLFINTSLIGSIQNDLKFNDVASDGKNSTILSNTTELANKNHPNESNHRSSGDKTKELCESFRTILCVIDGEVLGIVDEDFINYLRRFRQKNQLHFEIVEKTEALYVFTQAGRLMRPVYIKNSKLITWIGVMEQTNAVIYNNENYNSEYGISQHNISDKLTQFIETECDKKILNNQFENQYHKIYDTQCKFKLSKGPNTDSVSNHELGGQNYKTCDIEKISNPCHKTPSDEYKNNNNTRFPGYFYREIHTDLLFSYVAGTIPFLEYNQSPRNMYECQMVKQAMSYNTILNVTGKYRCDNKAYSLTSLQKPLVTTNVNALMGINVFIAVLCYTSYDMEDAMVLNKSSVDRGLFDGAIYKVKIIDKAQEAKNHLLKKNEEGNVIRSNTENDPLNLPEIGQRLENGDVLYSYYNKNVYYEDEEPCTVHFIRLTSNFVIITLRIRRSPEIGDKFCSRHGQKGVMSRKMRAIDLPFNTKGISPDLIINPHAFPSRMTIGMMLEILISHLTLFYGTPVRIPAFHNLTGFSLQNMSHEEQNQPSDIITGSTEQISHGSPMKSRRGHQKHRNQLKFENKPTFKQSKTSQVRTSSCQADFQSFVAANEMHIDSSHVVFKNHTGINETLHPDQKQLGPNLFKGTDDQTSLYSKDAISDRTIFLYEKISSCLKRIGFNLFSNDLMMSGITGRPLRSLVFSGMCYYQRLRHMVLDKWQVRSTGLVNVKTRQPVKGRKRGGGVRFGEMEKAALIAHGTSSLLHDRLMDCSDKTIFEYCLKCKTFLFVRNHVCLCGSKKIKIIEAPFVLKYLLSELLAMNIFVEINISE